MRECSSRIKDLSKVKKNKKKEKRKEIIIGEEMGMCEINGTEILAI